MGQKGGTGGVKMRSPTPIIICVDDNMIVVWYLICAGVCTECAARIWFSGETANAFIQ